MLKWLQDFFSLKDSTAFGTTTQLCENLSPDLDGTCTKFEEHTGPCSYPIDNVAVQWQMEDSANYDT